MVFNSRTTAWCGFCNGCAIFLVLHVVSLPMIAQHEIYVGALGGLATLSGDGRSVVSATSVATSLYDPENGGAASAFAGIHLFNYLSVQGNYIWNHNGVTLVSSVSNPATFSFYQQPVSSTQNAFVGDLLVYFRRRESRIRPYLSQGGGLVRISSHANGNTLSRGNLPVPGALSSAFATSRTSVGLDVRFRSVWFLRYTFGENISHNPITAQLSPPGQRLLKNFQNLWGIYRRF
jgi:hypothetical protein